MAGHGWVRRNESGAVARCGGPALCTECKQELADYCIEILGLEHSEACIIMFLGYIFTQNCLRPDIRPSEMLDVWANFKAEMGKR
jgi:hypothetical protein